MAKRKQSNIQRRNLPNKSRIGHPSIGNPKKETVAPVEPKHENTYLFTMIGMFTGMLIGLIFDQMALGFGIGIVMGGIIDFILSEKRKKEILAQNEDTIE